ncbi:hypothetical protein [Aciditerrimonas ferrireducens]|uniref:hypothetical protein n=1 Tax=Aciditerrimonas ferrireducens TaxID=667306 RepID=UPI0020030582|nr:hypothetical protein [Aciditerrimonas ferrireducens]MCK4177500.1 hypothetical protein [Aciditerrimonas ferrireducens]
MPVRRSSERTVVRQQTAALLHSLGATPGEVAASLAAAGVRGVPANSRECAVAVYLGAVVSADPRVRGVKVCKSEVLVERSGWWRRSVVVPLPSAVRQFIAAFDARSYPELVRPGLPAGIPPMGQDGSSTSPSSALPQQPA